MVTPKREWFPGVSYHITSRGNHRNDIFRDEADFGMYLILMKECLKYYEKYNYKLICYCLMTNHVHLLIQANDKEVSDLIRRLHSMYSRYFNKKYKYIGHLWQDKYFPELIKDDKQMLTTSRYIHLNPFRAKMVKMPEEYEWSSYKIYIGEEKDKLISSETILLYFKEDNKHKLYRDFVESDIKIKIDEIQGGSVNGSSS
ncbi:MAG TPA: transposase [Clostridium sp.]|uniref:REP-associated tyrosine transposase n=1 Tax=Clostridium sp. TaxID=1506 RepID=UPI002F92BEDA